MLKPSFCKKLTGREVALMVLQNGGDVLKRRPQSFAKEEINIAMHQLPPRELADFKRWMAAIQLMDSSKAHAQVALYQQGFYISSLTPLLDLDTQNAQELLPKLTEKTKTELKFYFEVDAILKKFSQITGQQNFELADAKTILEPVLHLYYCALISNPITNKEWKAYIIDFEALKPSSDWLENLDAVFDAFPSREWSERMDDILKPNVLS